MNAPAKPAALRLRWWLLLVSTVAILPLALVCGSALWALLQQQLEQTEQAALDLTRALATAVDSELRLSISALQTMALTEAIVNADEGAEGERAYRLAVNVLPSRPEWRALLLVKPSGEVAFNTGVPLGTPPPRAVDGESLAEMLRRRAPVIGNVTSGRNGNAGVAIRVPVLRNGEVRYALTAILRPAAVLSVVARQRVPDDWTVSVFDAELKRVARSRDSERFVGTPPSDTLRALIGTFGDKRQLYGSTTTLEGERVHAALARLDSADWIVSLGVPKSASEAALTGSALAYGAGLVLSVLLGAAVAWLLSRRIERPMARLGTSASALGRGKTVVPQPSGIRELDAMAGALALAADQRALAGAEREASLEAERVARAAAESAQRRLRRLVEASALLSSTLEEASTLQAIASIMVPDVADACRLDLLDAQGVLQRKITYHVDPVRQRAIEEFVARHVAPPDTPGTFPWAIKTGRTFLAQFPKPGEVPMQDPEVREFARIVGIRSVYVVPLVARGQTIGAMAVMQAESGRTLTDDDGPLIGELAQRFALALDNVRLYAESRAAVREASIANRAKDEFLAMLGHELRNPLAPIVTSLETMARRTPDADGRERRVIERQVRHLSRLVDDLLDVSRIASGKVELHRDTVDLRQVVARALEQIEPMLASRSAPRVAVPDEPVWVDGDAVRLAQVVCNLLINAAKFSDAAESIDVVLERTDAAARLCVRDRGIGIAPELMPHIFERFVQGDQALHRSSGGLGLGLAIARNLVELHGGTIEAESAGLGAGSTFVVTLPLATRAAAAPLPSATAVTAPQALRLLVVDDNVDAAESLALLLAMDGHEVKTAASGTDALQLLERYTPHIALLDIGLPVMDGYELARRMRDDARLGSIALVALTGYGSAADQERVLRAGFDVHLVKPVDFALLKATLARFDRAG
jgi:signal transduction histidine kinase/ActR/RegA family two-component response regulator